MYSSLTPTLDQIQHSGGRRGVFLNEFDEHFNPRQFLQTLMEAANSGAQRTTSQLVYAGPSVTEVRRWHGTTTVDDIASEPADPSLDAWKMVTQTAENGEFEIKLLVFELGDWSTVASYSYTRGRARRCIYYANGDKQPCFLDLPPHVVLEMAKEDFRRHWLEYYREFLYEPRERSLFPGRE